MFRHNPHIEDTFSEASQQILAGRDIESVLADYPDYAAELEPLLRLTLAVYALPTANPSPQALRRIEKRAHEAAKTRQHTSLTLVSNGHRPLQTRARSTLATRFPRWFPFFNASPRLAIALAAIAGILLLAGFFALQHGSLSPQSRPVESYSGVITSIAPTKWVIDAETEVYVDNLTEIHGHPVIGAQMTCIAERLGKEQFKAFEVWILTGPSTPTVLPNHLTGQIPASAVAQAP